MIQDRFNVAIFTPCTLELLWKPSLRRGSRPESGASNRRPFFDRWGWSLIWLVSLGIQSYLLRRHLDRPGTHPSPTF